MENNYIYLDNAATTKPRNEVVELFFNLETNYFGNSGSIHKLGINSLTLLNEARDSILKQLNLKKYNVTFVSSSTEANNIAIKGYCLKYKNRGNHIITSNVEHPSVLNCFKELESEGFRVTYLKVNEEGVINLDELKDSICEDTILISIMSINNEIGSINPIEEISQIVHEYPKINLHVDTTQAIGKIDIDYNLIDMFVLSAHKIHGLKGSGALISKNTLSFVPLIDGGGQEKGIRSGTVSVSHACCLAKALKLEMANNKNNIIQIHNYLVSCLKQIDGVELNSPTNCSPYITNFSLLNKKASVVVEALSNLNIYVSSVSACNSKGEMMSSVVKAIGKSDILAHNTIRVSLDENTTRAEIDRFIEALKNILENIK